MAKEYIELEALREVVNNLRLGRHLNKDAALNLMERAIDNLPPADVVEVKRGRWIKVGGDIHSSGYTVSCANCGKYHFVHYRGSLGGLYGHDELFEEPSQCPNCGAKMDGGDEND